MTIWILVASGSAARLFRHDREAGLVEIEDFLNPANRRHEGDLVEDQAGRARTRATDQSESYDEPDAREQERERFARTLCDRLEQAHHQGEFDALYLVSGDAFLGLLREHLDAEVARGVRGEVHKNLVRLRPEEIRSHLPDRL